MAEHYVSKVWTTVFSTGNDGDCYHVEWGKPGGPDISLNTVIKLSEKFLNENGKKFYLQKIYVITPTLHRYYGNKQLFWGSLGFKSY